MSERRAKILGRVKTKRMVNTPGWISKVAPPEPGTFSCGSHANIFGNSLKYFCISSGICEKCETVEAGRAGLQAEVERLRAELGSTRQTIVRLHDRRATNLL